jgi:polyhydroxyalkanoate synthesis repressor PhaR
MMTSKLLRCSISLNVEFLVTAVKDFDRICALQQEVEAMNSTKIVIKKYANRRLYDTSASRYINLEDIAALVRNGKEVQVVDAGTGEDLTRVTLTQIIVEDARGQPSGLPLELLRQLIVASDRVGQEFIMWYLNSAFDAYKKVQSSLQSRLSEMQTAALSPLQTMKNLLQNSGGEKSEDGGQELHELRQRLAELEAQRQKSAVGKALRRRGKTRTRRNRP